MAYFNDKLSPEGGYGAGCIYTHRLALSVLHTASRLLTQCLQSAMQVPRDICHWIYQGRELEEGISCRYDTHGQVHEKSRSSQREEGVEEEVRHVTGR